MINRVVCDEQHSSLINVKFKEIFYSTGTKPVTDVAYGGWHYSLFKYEEMITYVSFNPQHSSLLHNEKS